MDRLCVLLNRHADNSKLSMKQKKKQKKEQAASNSTATHATTTTRLLSLSKKLARKLPDLMQSIERIRKTDIYLIHGCLSPEESRQCIRAAESCGFSPQSSRGAAYGEAFRDHYRLTQDNPEMCTQVWERTGLKEVFEHHIHRDEMGTLMGLNPNLRMYRYDTGHRFGKHIDEACEVPGMGRTEYTLLVYLSDPVGGETVFYDDRGRVIASVQPKAGMALMHRHGDDYCLEHEAKAVLGSGSKYVLRSDVVYRK